MDKILFIDDFKFPNYFIFEKQYEFDIARNKIEAIEKWKNSKYTIVAIDYDMIKQWDAGGGDEILKNIISIRVPKLVYCISWNDKGILKLKSICDINNIPFIMADSALEIITNDREDEVN